MKNIVVCCDGTGNEIGIKMSNVLKLYRMLDKNDAQVVYYHPGIGTLGQRKTWGLIKQELKGFLGLATGYGLDDEVLSAYRFIAEYYYEEGDRIFLFGFSRGAYTVRVLAGFMHLLGLFRPHQLNYVGYALTAYKRAASAGEDLRIAWDFQKIVGSRIAPIKFIGVWDTVASVIVPRPDRFYLPSLETLPYTNQNPTVEVFRQACAIDEFRRMFRLRRWNEDQEFKPNRFSTSQPKAQDESQVWFCGLSLRHWRRVSGRGERPLEVSTSLDDRRGEGTRPRHQHGDGQPPGRRKAEKRKRAHLCAARCGGKTPQFRCRFLAVAGVDPKTNQVPRMAETEINLRVVPAAL